MTSWDEVIERFEADFVVPAKFVGMTLDVIAKKGERGWESNFAGLSQR